MKDSKKVDIAVHELSLKDAKDDSRAESHGFVITDREKYREHKDVIGWFLLIYLVLGILAGLGVGMGIATFDCSHALMSLRHLSWDQASFVCRGLIG